MSSLVNERKTVQKPLLKYAKKMGWKNLSKEESISLRRGEQGKFFYEILEKKLISFNESF